MCGVIVGLVLWCILLAGSMVIGPAGPVIVIVATLVALVFKLIHH